MPWGQMSRWLATRTCALVFIELSGCANENDVVTFVSRPLHVSGPNLIADHRVVSPAAPLGPLNASDASSPAPWTAIETLTSTSTCPSFDAFLFAFHPSSTASTPPPSPHEASFSPASAPSPASLHSSSLPTDHWPPPFVPACPYAWGHRYPKHPSTALL